MRSSTRPRGEVMSVTVWIPRDAGALALGAEAVVRKLQAEAQAAGEKVTIRRNGSRGLYWLEPLVEVETRAGRIAYGPVDRARRAGPRREGTPEGRCPCAAHRADRGTSLVRVAAAPDLRARRPHRSARPRGLPRLRRLRRASRARSNSGPTRRSTKCWSRACAAAAARPSRPASSGRPCCASRPARSTSPATPTKATRARTPTAC